jgi:hypothetical protein
MKEALGVHITCWWPPQHQTEAEAEALTSREESSNAAAVLLMPCMQLLAALLSATIVPKTKQVSAVDQQRSAIAA